MGSHSLALWKRVPDEPVYAVGPVAATLVEDSDLGGSGVARCGTLAGLYGQK